MTIVDPYDSKATYFNREEIEKKALQTLLGICSGILADNEFTEAEFNFLRHWLLEHQQVLTEWPATFLIKKVNHVLEDGIVTADELDYLRGILMDMIGGNLQQVGTTKNVPTSLPVNKDAIILFPGKSFCFTGKFLYGTRKYCQERVLQLGGAAFDNVRKDLDYLVIGNIGSDAWVNTSYGRKIQQAIDFQEKGMPTLIINEEMWLTTVA